MKALTLWQPWATLVALGVKTVETRSWSTVHRGALAIHAATMTGARLRATYDTEPCDCSHPEPCDVHDRFLTPHAVARSDALVAAGYWPMCGANETPRDSLRRLPFGAIVATCTLVDVAPIGGPFDFRTGIVEGDEGDHPGRPVIVHHPPLGSFAESLVLDDATGRCVEITEQLPFGDYSPGRFAWLLADMRPLDEPIPYRGRQGLWKWDEQTA